MEEVNNIVVEEKTGLTVKAKVAIALVAAVAALFLGLALLKKSPEMVLQIAISLKPLGVETVIWLLVDFFIIALMALLYLDFNKHGIRAPRFVRLGDRAKVVFWFVVLLVVIQVAAIAVQKITQNVTMLSILTANMLVDDDASFAWLRTDKAARFEVIATSVKLYQASEYARNLTIGLVIWRAIALLITGVAYAAASIKNRVAR